MPIIKKNDGEKISCGGLTPTPQIPLSTCIKTSNDITHTTPTGANSDSNQLLPAALVAEFEEFIVRKRLNCQAGTSRFRAYMTQWGKVQQLITETAMPVEQLGMSPEVVYNYFESHSLSPSYCQKILRVLNFWGDFIEMKTGARFKRITPPTRFHLQRILDTHRGKLECGEKKDKASKPLDEKLLSKARQSMKREHYNWLYISLWLGLRGCEVDALKTDPSSYKIEKVEDITVLHVYQSKLRQIPKEKRWKLIPILLNQQRTALLKIREGQFRRPSTKILHKHLGEGVHVYGGRKGFADLLITKGIQLEAISLMLGHKSVATTTTFYADPVKLQVERIKNLSRK